MSTAGAAPAALEVELGQQQVEVDVGGGDGEREVAGVDRGERASGAAVGGRRGEQPVARRTRVAGGERILGRATERERVDAAPAPARARARGSAAVDGCAGPASATARRGSGSRLEWLRRRLRPPRHGRPRPRPVGWRRPRLDRARLGGSRLGRRRPPTGDDRRGRDRRLEDAEHLGERPRRGLVAGRRPEALGVSLDLAPALPRLGQLERPARRVARVGEPARAVEHVGEAIQQLGRLDPPPGRGQELGPAAQRLLVARRERERPAVRLERLGRPAHLHEDPADRGVRQRPVRRDRRRLAVRPDRGLVAGRGATRRGRAGGRPCSARRASSPDPGRGRRRRGLLRPVSHRSPRRAAPSGRGAGSRTGPR